MFIPLMSTVGITLLSILIAILVIALIVLLILYLKKRIFKQVESLKKIYDDYHSILMSDCKVMVNRLNVLGENSPEYKNLFDEKKKEFEKILSTRDKDISNALAVIDTLLKEKNLKQARENIQKIVEPLNSYRQTITNFNDQLSTLLRDDNDTRETSLSPREKYRNIKNFYEAHKDELKPLHQSFEVIFKNTEDTFFKFDELTNLAKYQEAKALLPQVTSLLNAITDIMQDLPSLVTRSYKVIPQKLEKLNADYQELLKQDFILDHLHVPSEIETITSTNLEIQNKLKLMDTTGVKEELDFFQSKISDIFAEFEKEKQAKVEFSSLKSSITESTYELEKHYTRHLNELPQYQQAFVLDKKYVNEISSLQGDIETIGHLKRELDSYLNNTVKQPYSAVTKKINDLKFEINKVKSTINDYTEYLDSLKQTSQGIYASIRSYFYSLKYAEYEVRSIKVTEFENNIKPRFDNLYQELKDIDTLLFKLPVDVTKCFSLYENVKTEADQLFADVSSSRKRADEAEKAIVKANSYRDFQQTEKSLDSAEDKFYRGDFKGAEFIANEISKTLGLTEN